MSTKTKFLIHSIKVTVKVTRPLIVMAKVFVTDTKIGQKLDDPEFHSEGIKICNTGDEVVSVAKKKGISIMRNMIIVSIVIKILPLLMQNLLMYLYKNP